MVLNLPSLAWSRTEGRGLDLAGDAARQPRSQNPVACAARLVAHIAPSVAFELRPRILAAEPTRLQPYSYQRGLCDQRSRASPSPATSITVDQGVRLSGCLEVARRSSIGLLGERRTQRPRLDPAPLQRTAASSTTAPRFIDGYTPRVNGDWPRSPTELSGPGARSCSVYR
jgi:hypothetical protein